jgi:hypothetical protein
MKKLTVVFYAVALCALIGAICVGAVEQENLGVQQICL